MANATVVVLLDARRMALRNGANPLKLWDQLQTRMRAAARTTASAPEWSTKFLRDLQIGAPDKELSRSIEALAAATQGRSAAWLALVEREHGYIIASARLEAERRKDAAAILRGDDAHFDAHDPEFNNRVDDRIRATEKKP